MMSEKTVFVLEGEVAGTFLGVYTSKEKAHKRSSELVRNKIVMEDIVTRTFELDKDNAERIRTVRPSAELIKKFESPGSPYWQAHGESGLNKEKTVYAIKEGAMGARSIYSTLEKAREKLRELLINYSVIASIHAFELDKDVEIPPPKYYRSWSMDNKKYVETELKDGTKTTTTIFFEKS